MDKLNWLRMERLRKFTPLVLGCVLSALILECQGAPGIYLISPPTANPRNDDNQEGMQPSESLWIGSHTINWSPLPLFLKFTNPGLYQEKKKEAQSRKFETKTPIIVAKKSFRSFDFEPAEHRYNRPVYQPTTRHASKLLSGVGSFPEFPPRPQLPQSYIEVKSLSNYNRRPKTQTGPIYDESINRADVTTPSPIFVSTSASLLVSPPQAVEALSGPGENIRPITDTLKKMTEWSKQSEFVKKEGRPTPVYPFKEKKLRLKKRVKKAKQHKNNIADIIAANDDEEDTQGQELSQDRTQIIRPKRLKEEDEIIPNQRIPNQNIPNLVKGSVEDVFRPSTRSNNLVIIHPTNAAYLIKDPNETQQRSFPRHRPYHPRKEKRLGLFKKEGSSLIASSPMSFRFGPEDARVSPYRF